jgi:hypothetical protein
MADSYLDDYTKYRTTASGWDSRVYSIEDKIGRKDYIKVEATTTSGIDVDDAGTILV